MSNRCAIPLKFNVKSPAHALMLARKLVLPIRHWTTGDLAVTSFGESVNPKDARAEMFCALGALSRVNTKHMQKAEKFLHKAAKEIFGYGSIIDVNDAQNDDAHANVLRAFTHAIKLAKAAARG